MFYQVCGNFGKFDHLSGDFERNEFCSQSLFQRKYGKPQNMKSMKVSKNFLKLFLLNQFRNVAIMQNKVGNDIIIALQI